MARSRRERAKRVRECTHRLPRGRGLAFRDRGWRWRVRAEKQTRCRVSDRLSWKSARSDGDFSGDFQFADSLRACKTLLLAPPLRAVPLRRAEYVSSHTCQLSALGKKKKLVVQSKINRPVEFVGLIGPEIWFLRFPGYHSASEIGREWALNNFYRNAAFGQCSGVKQEALEACIPAKFDIAQNTPADVSSVIREDRSPWIETLNLCQWRELNMLC